MITKCLKCGSDDIYYYVNMILKCSGTLNKDGTIDEVSDHAEIPLKYKITGYYCLCCGDENEIV